MIIPYNPGRRTAEVNGLPSIAEINKKIIDKFRPNTRVFEARGRGIITGLVAGYLDKNKLPCDDYENYEIQHLKISNPTDEYQTALDDHPIPVGNAKVWTGPFPLSY